jgi:hypothetical protein
MQTQNDHNVTYCLQVRFSILHYFPSFVFDIVILISYNIEDFYESDWDCQKFILKFCL